MTGDEIERLFRAEIQRIRAEPAPPPGRPLFRQACSFHLSGLRALEPRKLSDGKTQVLLPPAIVNLAFACELYLKALLVADGRIPRGRTIGDLFGALAEPHRRGIEGEYGPGLAAEIDRFSRVFVDWRNVYEKMDLRILIGDLHRLVGCFHIYVADAHPEWPVHPDARAEIERAPVEAIALTLYVGQGRAVRVIYNPPVKPRLRS